MEVKKLSVNLFAAFETVNEGRNFFLSAGHLVFIVRDTKVHLAKMTFDCRRVRGRRGRCAWALLVVFFVRLLTTLRERADSPGP